MFDEKDEKMDKSTVGMVKTTIDRTSHHVKKE